MMIHEHRVYGLKRETDRARQRRTSVLYGLQRETDRDRQRRTSVLYGLQRETDRARQRRTSVLLRLLLGSLEVAYLQEARDTGSIHLTHTNHVGRMTQVKVAYSTAPSESLPASSAWYLRPRPLPMPTLVKPRATVASVASVTSVARVQGPRVSR